MAEKFAAAKEAGFDGVELGRVVAEVVRRTHARRIEWADPVVRGERGASEPDACGHQRYDAAGDMRKAQRTEQRIVALEKIRILLEEVVNFSVREAVGYKIRFSLRAHTVSSHSFTPIRSNARVTRQPQLNMTLCSSCSPVAQCA